MRLATRHAYPEPGLFIRCPTPLTIFSSFRPRTEVTDADGDPVVLVCGSKDLEGRRCARAGNSNIFAVNVTNANGLLQDSMVNRARSVEVSTSVSNPFTEPGGSKNPEVGGGGTTADDLDQGLRDIMESLKALFPKNCKFANYRIDVKTVAADTTIRFIAPIPVCIVDKNWKEF